jgi:hypothetical protein
MWIIIKRGIIPGLLLIVGLASLIYGSRFRFEPVLTERKTEVTIEVLEAAPQIPGPFDDNRQFAGPPQMRKQTVQRTEEVAINLSEPAMIRDVTVGGLTLNKLNELKRTYGGKPPTLCPT